MKYIPKSKLGAASAAAYLLILLGLILVIIFNADKGPHSGAAMLVILVLFLTGPLSWWAYDFLDSLFPYPAGGFAEYAGIIIIVVCALFNAAVIYFLAAALSSFGRKLAARFRKPLK